ncbi:hypothetical protein [Actinomadura rayongensis]|uniref:Uncharacterized protein n=1 Tax=Actinomadura rayongensis TaxID=1429076 RepID=A0A6I4WCG9_9ACTN|nr:hypothetical protein [Actinomadura rayongensis]MXQ64442.1 hypothetical protein [Actinomadura rayongensis]
MTRDDAASAAVQWALIGKEPHGWGYEVLECSDGLFQREDFAEMNQRYSPGTPEELPQVTVARAASGENAHLTLAIEEESTTRDAGGRDVVVTRLYAVPYARLAARAVSYEALYRACAPLALPVPGRATPVIGLPAPDVSPFVGRIDDTVVQTAALLLTGAPVQIVGAGGLPLDERLRFLDTVAAMLPYGIRTKFSASTWTSSTAQHQIRLSFTRHPRDSAHTVEWGRPAAIPQQAELARAYRQLISQYHDAELLELMAAETAERGFRPPDLRDLLAVLRRGKGQLQLPAALPAPGTSTAALLLECADALDGTGDLEDATARLAQATSGVPGDADPHHWEIISGRRMLAPRAGIPAKRLRPLYKLLVPLACGRHIRIGQVKTIEAVAGGLHQPLLDALYELRAQAEAEAQLYLGQRIGGGVLRNVLNGLGDAVLVEVALRTEDWTTADTVHQALVRRGSSGQGAELAGALRRGAFLAPVFARFLDTSPPDQRSRLAELLRAAYGKGPLGRSEAEEALSGRPDLVTPALLGAVLALYDGPDARDVLVDGYLTPLLANAGLGEDTGPRILARIAPPPPAPAPPEPATMPQWVPGTPPPPVPQKPPPRPRGGIVSRARRRLPGGGPRPDEGGAQQNGPPPEPRFSDTAGILILFGVIVIVIVVYLVLLVLPQFASP